MSNDPILDIFIEAKAAQERDRKIMNDWRSSGFRWANLFHGRDVYRGVDRPYKEDQWTR